MEELRICIRFTPTYLRNLLITSQSEEIDKGAGMTSSRVGGNVRSKRKRIKMAALAVSARSEF